MRKLVILLPLTSAMWFLTTILFGGLNHPNYRHYSQFISELGASGAVNGQLVNLFGFIPTSAFLTAFVMLAIYISSRQTKQLLGLAGIGLYSLTLCVAALFPCDAGCRPVTPSVAQLVHNLSAIFGYMGGVIGIFLLASDLRNKASRRLAAIGFFLGAIAIAMFFLLSPESLLVGLAQRVFEFAMYAWIIIYAFHLRAELLNNERDKPGESRMGGV